MPDEGARAYLAKHIPRLARTLALVPPPQNTGRVLELGCYMQITPLLSRLCGYREVRGAYYGAPGRTDRKAMQFPDGEFSCDVDHFDAERDRFPYPDGHFDLVIAAHVLNELSLGTADRAVLVATWCEQLLARGGTCLVLEPALRETSRALLEVRDALVTRGLFVIAPCLWQGPCPALARPRDWCHDAAPSVAAGRSRVDFSYLAVRQAGDPSTDTSAYRVVSDPLPEKGRLRLYGCGPAGRTPLVRLSRDRSAANAALDQAARGDLIAVHGASLGGDGLRIGKDTTVEHATPLRRQEGERS